MLKITIYTDQSFSKIEICVVQEDARNKRKKPILNIE